MYITELFAMVKRSSGRATPPGHIQAPFGEVYPGNVLHALRSDTLTQQRLSGRFIDNILHALRSDNPIDTKQLS